jgi:hypothetical protein
MDFGGFFCYKGLTGFQSCWHIKMSLLTLRNAPFFVCYKSMVGILCFIISIYSNTNYYYKNKVLFVYCNF